MASGHLPLLQLTLYYNCLLWKGMPAASVALYFQAVESFFKCRLHYWINPRSATGIWLSAQTIKLIYNIKNTLLPNSQNILPTQNINFLKLKLSIC